MRLIAAPWTGMLAKDVWLKNAQHANEAASLLEEKLRAAGIAELAFPREANALFLRLRDETVAQLHARGWRFYKFIEPDIYRLMCSWATSKQDIDDFVADFEETVT
jgi:threonine aldolase